MWHAGRGSSTACSSSAVWSISTWAITSSSTIASSSIDELADLLTATDVFVTPYRNREQISSGALTFAVAAGCAAISTPYWYAEDMLSSGAGRLVPFDDSAALAEAVCDFAEQPELLEAAHAEARRIGAELTWPRVAEATAAVLREAAVLAPRRISVPLVELELDERRRTTCSRWSTTSASCSTRTA